MKQAGRPARYIFGVWTTILVASGVAAWLGYAVVGRLAQVLAAQDHTLDPDGLALSLRGTAYLLALAQAGQPVELDDLRGAWRGELTKDRKFKRHSAPRSERSVAVVCGQGWSRVGSQTASEGWTAP